MEIAVFAGGCFWCTEAIFEQLKGVIKVTSGYTGGQMDKPDYENVSSGQTGHAEAIQIEFDPKIISFKDLLYVFLKTHDPTTPDQQEQMLEHNTDPLFFTPMLSKASLLKTL